MKVDQKMQLDPIRCGRIQILATDMDGTFFSSGLKVRSDTLEAYLRAKKEGLVIVPATGRSMEGVRETLQYHKLDTHVDLAPGVYLNGCFTLGAKGKDDILEESSMPWCTIERVYHTVKKINDTVMSVPGWDQDPLVKDAPASHGFKSVVNHSLKPVYMCLAAYSQGEIVFDEENQLTDGLRQFRDGVNRPVGSLLKYAQSTKLNKLLVLTHCGAIIERHSPEIANGDPSIALTAAIPRILEIIPAGMNKAAALQRVATSMGLTMNEVAAIGDGDNDLEMLRAAAVSIAMGNAPPSVAAVAHMVTQHVDNGGWAAAVNYLLDVRQKATAAELNEP